MNSFDNTPDIMKTWSRPKSKPLSNEEVEYLASSDLLTPKEMKDIFEKMKEVTDRWQCKQCSGVLTKANTSCASESENMCQECHTNMIENNGWK